MVSSAELASTSGIPSPGQLVTVRQRRFVVTDIHRSALPAHIGSSGNVVRPQHLVRLASIDDEGRGDELSVIWEIEPGTRVHERTALPDPSLYARTREAGEEPRGFDDARRLDAFLDAVRWGAVASADVRTLHAPFRSGITIEDYQLDPVARALSMPRVNLLVADDVGLGKTIEAGLVVQELILRHRARTVLVVCPAGLVLQWRDQMRDKFGLEFRVIDNAALRDLRRRRGLHVNPWTHFPRLITSIDFLKRDRMMRLFREVLPPEGQPAFPRRFDLLIIDEAHNVAPSGRGQYALDSMRTQAIRTLAPHFEHKLFLSATPHNGYTESFSALLELLDDQRFCRSFVPDKAQLTAVMVRRMKSEIKNDLGGRRFAERRLEAIEVDFPEEERNAHALLAKYTKLRADRAEGDAEKIATDFVAKILKKRLFSSPEAFRLTLEKHRETLRGVASDEKKRATRKPSMGILRREIEGVDEENADDEASEERLLGAVETGSSALRQTTPEEEAILNELARWAKKASEQLDAKARALVDWLKDLVRPNGTWSNTRVIVFTEYRATQNWLQEHLAAHGLSQHGRLVTLYGGMDEKQRELIKAGFQADPSVSAARVLLATDAASEGIDLQNHCSRLVHYEIPWNPNRMEQRNGRVDRHGQRADHVAIHHFVGKGWAATRAHEAEKPGDLEGDLEYLFRAARKVDQIREDLGNVGDVIQQQVEEAMLGRRRTFDPERNAPRAQAAKAALKIERKLREQVQKLQEKLEESQKSLHLSPERLRAVVEVGLELAGHPPLVPVDVTSTDGRVAKAFRVPALGGTWAGALEGLAHPYTREMRPIVFDNDAVKNRDDVVLAHLGHKLVQMCLNLLRAEVWAPEEQRKLYRVSARIVPSGKPAHPVIVAFARLVVLGEDGGKLHEEVLTAGAEIKKGKAAKMGVKDVAEALDVLERGKGHDAPENVRQQLAKVWPDHAEVIVGALEARKRDRVVTIEKALAERAEKEVADLTAVLEELKKTIERELSKEEAPQLSLFDKVETEQFERNREALVTRLKTIPDEIVRESVAIRARYASPQARLFPVAITYVVPEGSV